MTRYLTMTTLTLALALTPMAAAPARADSSDIGKFVAGALTLMIITRALNVDARQKAQKKAPPVQQRRHAPPPPPRHYRPYGRFVPAECFFRIQTNNGPRGVFGKRCLNETMRHTSHLPRSCERTVRVRYGRDAEVFDAQCLRERGYRVEARRR